MADLERTPDGHINNCAIANGDSEENCQICFGRCLEEKPSTVIHSASESDAKAVRALKKITVADLEEMQRKDEARAWREAWRAYEEAEAELRARGVVIERFLARVNGRIQSVISGLRPAEKAVLRKRYADDPNILKKLGLGEDDG